MFDGKANDSALENGYPDAKYGKVCQAHGNSRIGSSSMIHPVRQLADAADSDGNVISNNESEVIRRNDAGPGQKNDSMRKTRLATEPTDQVFKRSRHSIQAGGAFEDFDAIAFNRETNRDMVGRRHTVGECDDRPQGTAIIVDLGLWQVERIFSLDVASAHVVADREPDDLKMGRDDQSQLRLGHAPLAVAANVNPAARIDHALRIGLEEQFRPI